MLFNFSQYIEDIFVFYFSGRYIGTVYSLEHFIMLSCLGIKQLPHHFSPHSRQFWFSGFNERTGLTSFFFFLFFKCNLFLPEFLNNIILKFKILFSLYLIYPILYQFCLEFFVSLLELPMSVLLYFYFSVLLFFPSNKSLTITSPFLSYGDYLNFEFSLSL